MEGASSVSLQVSDITKFLHFCFCVKFFGVSLVTNLFIFRLKSEAGKGTTIYSCCNINETRN